MLAALITLLEVFGIFAVAVGIVKFARWLGIEIGEDWYEDGNVRW